MIVGLIKKSFLITMTPSFQKNKKKKTQFINFMPSVNWILSKKIFNSLEQMDEKMLRNEDWDFIYKMKKTKYKLLYSPDTLIYHDNNTVFHFIKKRFIYGFYMWPILTKLNFHNYYFFLPLIFVIFLISFPLGFFLKYYFMFYLLTFSIYLITVLWESIRVSKNLITFIFILPVLIIGNISPGFGVLFGFYNYLKNKV